MWEIPLAAASLVLGVLLCRFSYQWGRRDSTELAQARESYFERHSRILADLGEIELVQKETRDVLEATVEHLKRFEEEVHDVIGTEEDARKVEHELKTAGAEPADTSRESFFERHGFR